jgi:hypothetical protein
MKMLISRRTPARPRRQRFRMTKPLQSEDAMILISDV